MRSQFVAAKAALGKLGDAGRMDLAETGAYEAMILKLADMVDGDAADEKLWREYRMAWKDLLGAIEVENGGTPDGIEKLLEAIRSSPEVRDKAPARS